MVSIDGKRSDVPDRKAFLAASTTRLRRLQQLCSRTGRDSSPSVLLFICGVDGKFNPYGQAVFKYLFLGTTGRDLRNSEIDVEHDILEDCVLIVRRHEVHLLYSETAANLVLPVIARWPNCWEYVLPIADADDSDLFQDHKIRAFHRMVRKAAVQGSPLGIPFPKGFDNFRDVEMWPLVQSFALNNGEYGDGDSSGGGGGSSFFTMEYSVQDVAPEVLRVFGSVDALVVENCVLRGSGSLAHHLAAMRGVLHSTVHGKSRCAVSEKDLVAPLQLLHDFGVIQDENRGGGHRAGVLEDINLATPDSSLSSTVGRLYPRVLLGTRADAIVSQQVRSSAEYTVSNTSRTRATKTGARSSVHFVVEAEEPSTGVCVCRTNFLTTCGEDFDVLMRAYRVLCAALPRVISVVVSRGASTQREVEEQATTSAKDTLVTLKTIDPEGNWRVIAFVRAIDACRVPVPKDKPLNSGGGGCILYTRLALSGSLGTVAVGDSYALVPNKNSSIWQPLLATGPGCSAYLAVWDYVEGEEDGKTSRRRRGLQDRIELAGPLALGTPLSLEQAHTKEGIHAMALFADSHFPSVDGKLRLVPSGLSFHVPGCAPIVVSMISSVDAAAAVAGLVRVKAAGIIEVPGYAGMLLLFLLKFHEGTPCSNPLAVTFPFLESTESFAIPLCSGSPLVHSILQALASWKEARKDGLGCLVPTDIPSAMSSALDHYGTITCAMPNSGGSDARERVSTTVIAAAAKLALKTSSLNAAVLSAEYRIATAKTKTREDDCGRSGGDAKFTDTVLWDGAAIASVEDIDRGVMPATYVPATVLLGLPGSGVLTLAAAILRFSSAEIDWAPIVVFTPVDDGIDELDLHEAIGTVVPMTGHATSATRVLVAVSAKVSAAALCTTLARWRREEQGLRITACTACLNLADSVPGKGGEERWNPLLVDQCAPGFVSNVVFAREDDERHALGGAWASATQLRRRLRLANPSLAFLTGCSVNYMSREAMNSILSDDVFDSPLFAEARRDAYGPGWAYLRLPGTTTAANNNSDNDGFLRTQKRSKSLEVRPVGAVDKCSLLTCLSALFPAASLQVVDIPKVQRPSWMGGMEEKKAATETISGQGGDRDGVSSILRASELARVKITKQQRREKKAKGIDLAIQRWTREQEQDTRLADHAREKKRNGVDAADSPSKTPPSIVGVIQIESPAVACATDDSCGTYTNTSALLEATPEMISLSRLPLGSVGSGAVEEGASDDGVLIVRACSARQLDRVAKLLATVTRSTSLAPLRPKTREDMSAAQVEQLQQDHKYDPLPEGWFFDGSVFLDYDGNRRRDRPDTAEIVDKHLQLVNMELRAT